MPRFQIDVRLALVYNEGSIQDANIACNRLTAKLVAELVQGCEPLTQILTNVSELRDGPLGFKPRIVDE